MLSKEFELHFRGVSLLNVAPSFHQPELMDWRKQNKDELGKITGLGMMLGEHPHPPAGCTFLFTEKYL